jgi:hypothetical protein
MLRAVRSSSASSQGVRFLSLLISWIAIAGGLLAATSANAGSSELLAQNTTRAGNDSVTFAEIRTLKRNTTYSLHLHGGLFAPVDVNAPSPTVGIRFGRFLGSHLQGGLLGGWTFRRKNLEEPVNGLPGLKPHLVLARIDGHLVPAMLFLQVNLTEKRSLVPYAGIAAGYEWFSILANDYRTSEKAWRMYSNWAWEGWGGIGLRLGENLRVDGELYYNGGSLERDVTDASGRSWLEAVDMNGVGARVGMDILF